MPLIKYEPLDVYCQHMNPKGADYSIEGYKWQLTWKGFKKTYGRYFFITNVYGETDKWWFESDAEIEERKNKLRKIRKELNEIS